MTTNPYCWWMAMCSAEHNVNRHHEFIALVNRESDSLAYVVGGYMTAWGV